MAAPTYSELLDLYKSALAAVSTNQSYSIHGRTLTRANLSEIRTTISWLEQKVADEEPDGDDETGTGWALARF